MRRGATVLLAKKAFSKCSLFADLPSAALPSLTSALSAHSLSLSLSPSLPLSVSLSSSRLVQLDLCLKLLLDVVEGLLKGEGNKSKHMKKNRLLLCNSNPRGREDGSKTSLLSALLSLPVFSLQSFGGQWMRLVLLQPPVHLLHVRQQVLCASVREILCAASAQKALCARARARERRAIRHDARR